MEIGTTQGPALAGLSGPGLPPGARPPFLLVLTHGAGGAASAPDLPAARDAGIRLGGTVALVTQPYRVRGARAPGSAPRQDEAWREIISGLRAAVPSPPGRHVPLVQGGRSNGARVACRTAASVGARGVLALAFPLRPPSRRGPAAGPGATRPDRSGELREARRAGADVLVVNGDRDPFGIPDASDATRVVVLPGEGHSLSKNPAAVSGAVRGWLSGFLAAAP